MRRLGERDCNGLKRGPFRRRQYHTTPAPDWVRKQLMRKAFARTMLHPYQQLSSAATGKSLVVLLDMRQYEH